MKNLKYIGGLALLLVFMMSRNRTKFIIGDTTILDYPPNTGSVDILIPEETPKGPEMSRQLQNSDYSPTLTTYEATMEEKMLYELSNRVG